MSEAADPLIAPASTMPKSKPLKRWGWRPKLPRRWDWRPKVRWFAAEIAVVVAGVLIALALNAWWANRDARARERLVLEDLREDFVFNKTEIQRIRGFSDLYMARFDQLAAISDDSIASMPPDSVYNYVLAIFSNWTYDPVTGSLDALIASGDLGLIRDRTLRERLTAFQGALRDSEEEKQDAYELIGQGLEKMSRLGGPWSRPGNPFPVQPEDLIRLRQDADYMAHARLTRWVGRYYALELSDVEQAIDSVLISLDTNLSR